MTELSWSSASAAGAAPDSSSAHFHKWQHRALARWWRCSESDVSLLLCLHRDGCFQSARLFPPGMDIPYCFIICDDVRLMISLGKQHRV